MIPCTAIKQSSDCFVVANCLTTMISTVGPICEVQIRLDLQLTHHDVGNHNVKIKHKRVGEQYSGSYHYWKLNLLVIELQRYRVAVAGIHGHGPNNKIYCQVQPKMKYAVLAIDIVANFKGILHTLHC